MSDGGEAPSAGEADGHAPEGRAGDQAAAGASRWARLGPSGRGRLVAAVAVVAVVALLAGIVAATRGDDGGDGGGAVEAAGGSERSTSTRVSRDRVSTTDRSSSTTTAVSSTTTTTAAAPTTTTTAPPTTTRPPATTTTRPAPPPPPPPGRSIEAFVGLGAWVDVLDWSPTYTGGAARMDPSEIDVLADRGVQTLYIQTSRFNRPEDILDEALLRSLVDRAHSRGLAVVGWYLPTFHDLGTDLRRLEAMVALGVDAVGVDIEDRTLADVGERNRRLLQLSADLRARLPHHPLAAIVFPPVVTDVINPDFWPDFPWAALAPSYDIWMPMSYWTNRTPASGWRDGYRYTAENIDMLRDRTGRPDLPVHTIGGIADQVSPADVDAMAWAVAEKGAVGGSLYDVRTTGDDLWPALQALRR